MRANLLCSTHERPLYLIKPFLLKYHLFDQTEKRFGPKKKSLVSAPQTIPNLASGRLLVRNTIWNLLGQLSPVAVALLTVPMLVRGLGVPRFGVLSLAWIVIGYFSFFDLGIGRALTKLVADRLGANEEHAIPPLAWTSLLLMTLLGVLGGLVMAAVSPLLVYRVLTIPAALQGETLRSFYLMAASIPLVTITSGLRGILEALQRFRILSLIRIPTTVFSFAGPLLVLPFSRSLVAVIAILIFGRLLGCLAHLIACFKAMPTLRSQFQLERSLTAPLVKFGGWMTVSNVLSPILIYIDRFFIGAILSVSMVAYYTAPFDTVTRLTYIPGAVAGVLFPAFAFSLVQDPEHTQVLLSRGIKYLFLLMFPVILVTVTLSSEILRLWLGPVFAEKGTAVLRWLAAGVFVNCFAQIPFALIQSAGRPDITAELHLIELPIYLAGVWFCSKAMGIEGTAIAWTGRIILDAALIFFSLRRILPGTAKLVWKVAITISTGLAIFYLGTLPAGLVTKICFLAISLLAFALLGWFTLLGPHERMFFGNRLQRQGTDHE
jgi:O-antigen/teichoic acid export membrane protein